MSKHALLSASSSKQWLNCPPSARLCEKLADETSDYAKEGTDAHTICEYKVRTSIGENPKNPLDSLSFFDAQMDEYTNDYRNFVMEQLAEAKKHCSDPVVFVEQRLDFTRWVPEGFGTGDCIIVADDVLHIIDFKYGMGVLVEAEDNPQMKLYALGALDLYDGIYDIKTVKMTIFQPRKGNISTCEMDAVDLLIWATDELAPTARLAYDGMGDYKAGEHCTFCKARSTCRKRAEMNMELAKYDFKAPPTLTNDEISAILPLVDELVSWGSDIKSYALEAALKGESFDGFKVVEGRSVRKYTDEAMVAKTVEKAGYDPYEKKVLGITAMTSLLGKSKFNELLSGLIEKPQGKPTLVPVSDKRPALNNAKDDFK